MQGEHYGKTETRTRVRVSHTKEHLGYQKLKDTGMTLVFRRCMIPLTP